MFDFQYAKTRTAHLGKMLRRQFRKEKQIVPLLWTEHCIECAAPTCYATCPRFKRRKDGNCIRVVDGITPEARNGMVGARITFRTWAKIESQLKISTLSGAAYGRCYSLITWLGQLFDAIASRCPSRKLAKFIYDGWFSYRQKYIHFLTRNSPHEQHLSLVGSVTNDHTPATLLIDIKSSSKLFFRQALPVPSGTSEFSLSIPAYNDRSTMYFINIHPADAEKRVDLTFDRLLLVPTDITKGKKVKCVIWDLDNTLWDGVLIEDREVKPVKELIALIKELDARGIVSSIASKNNPEEAERKLRELGIDDYFVFKKINWLPKSVNISNTIRQMNINPNSIVFVDDNPFERQEVALAQPSLTCVSPTEMVALSSSERFNVVVTDDARKRRKTYRMLESLKKEEEEWEGNIDDFLLNCHISVTLSRPTEQNIARCYELLQRTNQLNASGRRLQLDKVKAMAASEKTDCYVLHSADKFGDYGLVGFIITEKRPDGAHVTDFVISCRVANKKIEATVINHLARRYGGSLFFHYKQTALNGPMYNMIKELGMEKAAEDGDQITYVHGFSADFPAIVAVDDRA